MHFDEHSCSLFCELFSSAVDSTCTLFTAIVVFAETIDIICVLDTALDAVLEMAAAEVAANIVSDVAAGQQGSGHERGGWGLGRGAVG